MQWPDEEQRITVLLAPQLDATRAQLNATVTQLVSTAEALNETKYGLNTTFVLFGAFSVFVMQVGTGQGWSTQAGDLSCTQAPYLLPFSQLADAVMHAWPRAWGPAVDIR